MTPEFKKIWGKQVKNRWGMGLVYDGCNCLATLEIAAAFFIKDAEFSGNLENIKKLDKITNNPKFKKLLNTLFPSLQKSVTEEYFKESMFKFYSKNA